ncbi:tripartite tricarboxylate transporter TctB family protein [Phytohabitans sp. ZYX-F-186]|uniref:Tripartite tricarboxylate transporter TctB family protein n=1 Tax=Phytohabitans maris TaxID=3071409 RepID=A0ABU0ZDH7_9ACTN|nr:tripartite tricarboxylate transporter TctB family protein [Phytohabitans sp. ZYX-F-186]MDQ7905099.1 tripartite tricarboxylate transporter TctB family protein [Phytohabitans sp. ZYX-F-186]
MTALTHERPEGTVPPAAPGGRPLGPRITAAVVVLAGAGLLVRAIRDAAQSGVTVDGPRLAPLIVTGGWVVLAAAYTIQTWAGKYTEAERVERAPRASWLVPAGLLAALVGYALVLEYTVVGYVPATAAFFVAAARLLGDRPVRAVILRDVVVALGLSFAIYLAFTRFLDIQLPAGVLPL